MNGADVVKARLRHGMTQNEMAEALGVSAATVSRIENGLIMLTTQQRTRVGGLLSAVPSATPRKLHPRTGQPYQLGPYGQGFPRHGGGW